MNETLTRPGDAVGLGQNPFLFVVGCLRSGTTLLQRMLDSHPQLAVGYDSHFIPHPVKGLSVGEDPPLTPELVEQVCSHRRFQRLGLSEDAARAAAERARTYSGFVSGLYTEFGRLHGKPLAGEKSPGYCRHLPKLHGLFPWVRTIHLIRDGRDIALSVRDWGKGPAKLELWVDEPIAATALWWRWDVEMGRRDGDGLGSDHYFEVRYETLVDEPECTLAGIARFLGLPDAPEMATFHEGRSRDQAGLSAKAAWLPATSGLRDWRTQMPDEDVQLFEAIAGNTLEAAGYERRFDRIAPAIAETARRCEAWWADRMSRKQHAQAVAGQGGDR